MDKTPETRMVKHLGEVKADVCIIGAGMAGLSTAYQCASNGLRPILIDDGKIADGETSRTTAHLTNALDDRIYEIERIFGADGARLAVESHGKAIDAIEANIRREGIQCDFLRLDGYLFLQEGDKLENLGRELEAAHRAGFTGVERVARAPLDGFDTGEALRFPNQGQFHPLVYMQGLADAIERRVGPFLYKGHVKDVKGGDTVRVQLDGGEEISCRHAVVATNAPTTTRLSIHTKQAPYRTFVVGARVPKDSVPRALFWDTLHPYHYIRTQPSPTNKKEDILIVGGEDTRTGQSDDAPERWATLEAWASKRFPQILGFEYRWSGQVLETADGLAFLGRHPLEKNVYVITGDSGMGMTHTTIGSLLVTDLIMGRANPYEGLYDPSRKPLKTPLTWAMELLGQSRGYLRHVTPRETKSAVDVAPGMGAVVREGAKQVAYYRDAEGVLNAFSAVCSHLGCIVDWNTSEKSWECPCHGSRFGPMGEVLNGPAPRNLTRIETKEVSRPAASTRPRSKPERQRSREKGRIGEPPAVTSAAQLGDIGGRATRPPHAPRKPAKARNPKDKGTA